MIRLLKLTSLVYVAMLIGSCDKNKFYSRRVDDNKWQVSELSVNGVKQDTLPLIKFDFCDIYEETCEGSWSAADGKAQIAWQFRDKGKTLEISNQTDHGHDLADIRAAQQCIRLSGVYSVVDSKRKYLELKSETTFGYPNKTVIMKLKRN